MKINAFLSIALAAAIILTSCNRDEVDFGTAPAASLVKSGTVEVITEDNVRYHVINVGNRWTSTIVESETELTLVDVGMNAVPLPGYNGPDISNSGKELRAYANAINKPMSVIVTHPHVDHFMNLDNFTDVPVFAETKNAAALLAVAGNFDKTIAYLTDAHGFIKGTKNLPSGGKATSVQEVVDELKRLYPGYGEGGLFLALPNAFFDGDPGAKWF